MTDDVTRLEAALDAEPALTLLALADALEERVEEALAAAYRWLAANRKAPAWNGHTCRWWWRADAHGWGVGGDVAVPFGHSLPDAVYRVGLWDLPGEVGCRPYEARTASAAYRRAAQALARVGPPAPAVAAGPPPLPHSP